MNQRQPCVRYHFSIDRSKVHLISNKTVYYFHLPKLSGHNLEFERLHRKCVNIVVRIEGKRPHLVLITIVIFSKKKK